MEARAILNLEVPNEIGLISRNPLPVGDSNGFARDGKNGLFYQSNGSQTPAQSTLAQLKSSEIVIKKTIMAGIALRTLLSSNVDMSFCDEYSTLFYGTYFQRSYRSLAQGCLRCTYLDYDRIAYYYDETEEFFYKEEVIPDLFDVDHCVLSYKKKTTGEPQVNLQPLDSKGKRKVWGPVFGW